MACNCARKEHLLKKLSEIRETKELVYMDYNATTPVLAECMGAFESSCRKNWGNPSNCHPMGIKAWEELEKNRKTIASYFKTESSSIYFCSSGSEALFAGISGFYKKYKNAFIISTVIEHSSVIKNITWLEKNKYCLLNVSHNGTIDISDLEKILEKNSKKKILLVYSPVNHETGGIQPFADIYLTAKKYGAEIFFDAVQAASRIPAAEWRSYCDMFALSSHKLYAPKGCGVLALPKDELLNNFRFGGNQEGGIFPGTENTPAISAFAKAVEYHSVNFEKDLKQIKILTDEGLNILKSISADVVLESPETRAAGILCISLPQINDIENFLEFLYLKKICVSRFSACSDRESGASEILTAMGTPPERAGKSIRISTGIFSTREDYYTLANAIKEYLAKQ